MSLAERLKKHSILQESFFGEPVPLEALEELDVPWPVRPVSGPKPLTDPRPDLMEDSELWKKFLQLAQETNPILAGTLHGFRCQGTRIVRGKNGYMLRPELNPSKDGWSSRQEYERERDVWLLPHLKEIADLLKRL